MSFPARRTQGYSLIEILVVLAIIGVLTVVGATMLGNRQAAAVRGLLDELEGALNNARSAASSSSRDVAIETWGTWNTGFPNSMAMAFGDASLTPTAASPVENLQPTALKLLQSLAPDGTIAYSQSVVVPFHFLAADVSQARARVALAGSGDWLAAMAATGSGAANQDITTLDPFKTNEPMSGLVVDANNLFLAGGGLNTVMISGMSQRFTSTFIIQVVGTSPNNGPMPGSPMGLLVVLPNGGSIYKFYNPGVREGDGHWRRI
jgi:prepilin-type N-terminal cleavage/methylation domain-containing protein